LTEDGDHSLAAASLAEHDARGARRLAASHSHRVAETGQPDKCVASVVTRVHEAHTRRRVVAHVVKGAVAESKSEHRAAVAHCHVWLPVAIDSIRIKTDFALIDEGEQIDREERGVTHETPLID
jgi:hypothetical protein